jgi:hypothetical protein
MNYAKLGKWLAVSLALMMPLPTQAMTKTQCLRQAQTSGWCRRSPEGQWYVAAEPSKTYQSAKVQRLRSMPSSTPQGTASASGGPGTIRIADYMGNLNFNQRWSGLREGLLVWPISGEFRDLAGLATIPALSFAPAKVASQEVNRRWIYARAGG